MGLGRRAFGVDASPLGVAIARVRTTLLGEAGRERLVSRGRAVAEESGERARKRRRPDVPAWAREEIARFHAHVLFELLGLRELVMALPDDDVGRALRLCLSSLLVKFMKAGPTAPRDGAEKRIARGVPSRMLADRAAELARGLAALERRTPAGTAAPEIRRGTRARCRWRPAARRWCCRRRPTPAPTTTPPSTTPGSCGWGCRRRSSGACSSARGREHVGRRRRATPGARSRRRFMAEVARVLRPGGRALLVVGDGVVDGRAENAPDGIAAAGAAVGLEAVARASQARPLHDRRLAEIFGGSARAASTCCCCRRAAGRARRTGRCRS